MSELAVLDEQLNPVVLSKERLTNGVDLEFQDLSRRIAGDRWNVRLRAEVFIPPGLCRAFFSETTTCTVEGSPDEIEKWVSKGVRIYFHKERHFVAALAVVATLRTCEGELRETVLPYLHTHAFVAGAIARHCRERAKEEKMAAFWAATAQDAHEETNQGPADFSDCFRSSTD